MGTDEYAYGDIKELDASNFGIFQSRIGRCLGFVLLSLRDRLRRVGMTGLRWSELTIPSLPL